MVNGNVAAPQSAFPVGGLFGPALSGAHGRGFRPVHAGDALAAEAIRGRSRSRSRQLYENKKLIPLRQENEFSQLESSHFEGICQDKHRKIN